MNAARLMSPAPTEGFDREVRGLIELYSQAAQSTRDAGRRVAYLEKVALLVPSRVQEMGACAHR